MAAPPPLSPPSPPARKSPGRPSWGLASLVLVGIAIVVAVVIVATRSPMDSYRNHDPLEAADLHELRQVVLAISVIIRTPDAESEAPVAALEALRPDSPGVADLRDACVTTYRGLIDLARLQQSLHTLDPRDGGPPPSPAELATASATLDHALQIEHAVRDTKDRCLALYESACDRLGIHPAQREHPSAPRMDAGTR